MKQIVVVCAVAIGGAPAVASAGLVTVLDQDFNVYAFTAPDGNPFPSPAGGGEGQSFTVGLDGFLERIDLPVGLADGPIEFGLWRGTGYSGELLAMVERTAAELGSQFEFATVFDGLMIPIEEGDVLTVGVIPNGNFVNMRGAFSFQIDPYTRGTGIGADGTPISVQGEFVDFGLRTFVAVPGPGPFAAFAAAGVGLLRRKR